MRAANAAQRGGVKSGKLAAEALEADQPLQVRGEHMY